MRGEGERRVMRVRGVCVCVSLLPMMSGLWLVGGVTRVAPRGHAIRALDVVDVVEMVEMVEMVGVVEVVGVEVMERDGEGWRGSVRVDVNKRD